jgi:hypothetical protein
MTTGEIFVNQKGDLKRIISLPETDASQKKYYIAEPFMSFRDIQQPV